MQSTMRAKKFCMMAEQGRWIDYCSLCGSWFDGDPVLHWESCKDEMTLFCRSSSLAQAIKSVPSMK